MGERIGRVKVRKLMGWDKDSLIGKAKATHTSKAKQGIHSLLPVGRQVFSHLQESRAPSLLMATWETNAITPNILPFLLLHSALYAEHDVLWSGISLGSVGDSCPSCVPSQLLVPPQPLAGGAGWEAEKALALCKHRSAITRRSLCYQHCFQHKSKI